LHYLITFLISKDNLFYQQQQQQQNDILNNLNSCNSYSCNCNYSHKHTTTSSHVSYNKSQKGQKKISSLLDRSDRTIKQQQHQQATVQQITKQNSLLNRMDKMRQLAARKQPANKLYANNHLDRMSVSSGGSLSTSTSPVSLPSNDSTFQPITQQTLFSTNQHLQQQIQQTHSSTPNNNFMFSNPSTSNSSSIAPTLLDNNHQTQQTLASSLLPLYFASYLNAQNKFLNQTANPMTSQSTLGTTNAQSVDPSYLQNLLTTIYTLTTYQQQQQQQHFQAPDLAQLLLYQLANFNSSNNNLSTNSLLSTKNIFNTYNNCAKLLNLNQFQQQANDMNNNTLSMSQTNMNNSNNHQDLSCNATMRKKTNESPKIIYDDPHIDVELKVEEHFRRSLGNNYVKLLN